MLVEEGFEVVSVDASDKMLKYALKERWNRRKEKGFDNWSKCTATRTIRFRVTFRAEFYYFLIRNRPYLTALSHSLPLLPVNYVQLSKRPIGSLSTMTSIIWLVRVSMRSFAWAIHLLTCWTHSVISANKSWPFRISNVASNRAVCFWSIIATTITLWTRAQHLQRAFITT